MECFELLRKQFAMCGIKISQKSPKNPFNMKSSTIFTLVYFYASFVAVLLNEINTFDERTFILYQSSSAGCCGILYAIIVWKTSKLCEFINNLAETVNEKYLESQLLYTDTSRKVETWLKAIDFACIKVTPLISVLPPSIFSFYKYFTSDLGNSAFELPSPEWFPFDWKNPVGYLVAVLIMYIFIICVMVTVKCLLIFGFGTCSMLFPLTIDIKNNLKTINHDARHKKDRPKILDQFSKLVQFHSKLIQLIHDYSDFSKIIFLISLTWSIAGICGLMLMLKMKMDTNKSQDIVTLSLQIVWLFTAVFGICEFGERLSETFEEINDVYDQLTWYRFPYKVQQILTIPIMAAQKPVELHILGSMSCGRITFRNIFNKAYSFFMVLRRFGN